MPNAIVNGITIDYSTAGDGPPVLLICGTGQPADLWFAQVTDLAAAGHTVITFDNRGCGRSEAPPAPYSVTGMAADTAALIEHLGLGPCDVIGYSLGGYIAQELAVTRPGLVRRLVLLAGAGSAPAYAVARARAAADLARALTRSRPASTSPTCCCRCIAWPSSKTTTTPSDHHQPYRGSRTVGQPRAARPVPGRPCLARGQQPPGPARWHQLPLPGHGIRARLLVPPARRARGSPAHSQLPVHRATRPWPRCPLLAPGQVNPILAAFLD